MSNICNWSKNLLKFFKSLVGNLLGYSRDSISGIQIVDPARTEVFLLDNPKVESNLNVVIDDCLPVLEKSIKLGSKSLTVESRWLEIQVKFENSIYKHLYIEVFSDRLRFIVHTKRVTDSKTVNLYTDAYKEHKLSKTLSYISELLSKSYE